VTVADKPAQPKPIVVIGMLGSTLDAGKGARRWERWRPTVAMCRHDDLLISRLELLYQKEHSALLQTVVDDIGRVSPETQVRAHCISISDPWDLEQVYGALHDFALAYRFVPTREDYLVHITTGTHIAQISAFLLTESHFLPARILQTSPAAKRDAGTAGTYRIIDLDLSRYDQIAQRFRQAQREGLSFLKSGIDTRNAAFNRLIEQIERVAIASRDPILLSGPTGAGKSQLARRIYELKKARRQVHGALVDVNCATLRGDGAMSALFGHEKGAFTGASQRRAGHLRSADGGVLFWTKSASWGSTSRRCCCARSSTRPSFRSAPTSSEKATFSSWPAPTAIWPKRWPRGVFREDLLARIDLWSYRLPALRDRPEDIEPNLDYEAFALSRELR
jgi:transcriptional regulatory protein RtcR